MWGTIFFHSRELNLKFNSLEWNNIATHEQLKENLYLTTSSNIPICIYGILYFKLNGIDAINEIAKPRIKYCLMFYVKSRDNPEHQYWSDQSREKYPYWPTLSCIEILNLSLLSGKIS
jgi:hypothetical protein